MSDLITVVIQAIIPNDIILISVSNLLNVWIDNSVYSLIQGTIPDSFFPECLNRDLIYYSKPVWEQILIILK